jgi:hypothetical protein
MTKKSKTIRIILYLLTVFVLSFFFYKRDKAIQTKIQNQLSWSVNFTWNVFPPDDLNLTWDIQQIDTWNEVSLTDIDNYKNLLDSNNFIRKFNPPKQPIINWAMSYEEKSKILNDYLKDNNFYFRNPQKLKDWYLYIKLNKEISNWDIFLYFHDAKLNNYTVSWKLNKNKNLMDSSKEFLYKLDSVSIKKYYDWKILDYNRLNELNIINKLHYIWWYTTTSDWNYMEEIIIVWE